MEIVLAFGHLSANDPEAAKVVMEAIENSSYMLHPDDLAGGRHLGRLDAMSASETPIARFHLAGYDSRLPRSLSKHPGSENTLRSHRYIVVAARVGASRKTNLARRCR